MQILNMTKRRFEGLQPLELSHGIYNTEGIMFLMNGKSKWSKRQSVLKKLYHDSGELLERIKRARHIHR